MDVDVLGPLQATVDGRAVRLGGHQRRALLAALALHAGELVPMSRLVDVLWDASPPASAVIKVQGHVSALRRAIAEAGSGVDPRSVLVTQPPGYLLDLGRGRLDAAVFEALIQDAERAYEESRLARASEKLELALGLWRGPAFADVTVPAIQAQAARLEERRLGTVEAKAEVDLALSRNAKVVAEVSPLVAAYPLRERLRAHLMLALYRCGRQADALKAYREGRRILVEELGIEPGPELQRLEAQILAGRPPPSPLGLAQAPCELPSDQVHFTGRPRQVAQLLALLQYSPRRGGALVVAITGAPGVGKTALAIHAAHRVRDLFPDGQRYVDLRSAEQRPLDPEEVLGRFLRELGVPGHAVPDEAGGRAALYRAMLADRRMLVVLDNAASERQVRPLLPGGPSCAVLVTSRSALSGLDLTARLTVNVLPEPEARRLFVTMSGERNAPPAEVRRVVRHCGLLPLAIRIAAARLAARPHWTVTDLADRLADRRSRLHELAAGDLDVRASLALSYDNLGDQARRAFRLLALVGDAPLGVWRLAALLDTTPRAADGVLERLVEHHLIEPHGRDTSGAWTYRMHDLVHLYSLERLAEEPPERRTAALRRLLGALLVLAEEAEDRLMGPIPRLGRGPAPRHAVEAGLRSRLLADPLAWLEPERRFLVAAVESGCAEGMSELGANLACAVLGYLLARVYWDDAQRVLRAAQASITDPLMSAHLRRAKAELAAHRGDQKEAASVLGNVATELERLGDHHAACFTRWSLAEALRSQGRFDEAGEQAKSALDSARRLAERRAEGMALCTLGRIHDMQGDTRRALELYELGLDLLRDEGDQRSECYVLRLLAITLSRLGRTDEAIGRLRHARELSRALRDDRAEAVVTNSLATILLASGGTVASRRLFDEILGETDRLAVTPVEAFALRGRATCDLLDGHVEAAIDTLHRSLVVLRQLGLEREVAVALRLLGVAYGRAGQEREARGALLAAADLRTQLGLPDADEIAALVEASAPRAFGPPHST
jgi:DNA-binding SARP family transcriptional activator